MPGCRKPVATSIAHDVAVVVLAGPDESAFTAHNAGNGVIDEGVEIGDAGFFETILVIAIKDFLENIFEAVVVDLGDGVLGRKPTSCLVSRA